MFLKLLSLFKNTPKQEAHALLEASFKEEGPEKRPSIYEAVIRPIVNRISGKGIINSSKETTPQETEPLLKASK